MMHDYMAQDNMSHGSIMDETRCISGYSSRTRRGVAGQGVYLKGLVGL